MVVVRALVLTGMVVAITLPLQAQERAAGTISAAMVSDSGKAAAVSFTRFLDTYKWVGTTVYKNSFGPFSLSLNEQFLSTLIYADKKLINDTHTFELLGKQRVTDNLRAIGRVSSFIVSDTKSLGLSNVSSNAVYAGVEFQPFRSVVVAPAVGLRIENQIDAPDRGVSYLLDLTSRDLEYEGYRTRINGAWKYDRLAPRTSESRALLFSTTKKFFEQSQNSFQFSYLRNQRDFYSPADSVSRSRFSISHNIDTRSEDAFAVVDTLDYAAGSGTLLTFHGAIFAREIDRGTRYRYYAGNKLPGANTVTRELRIEGSAQARYTMRNNLSGLVRFLYQERDEQHEAMSDDSLSLNDALRIAGMEERKNNHSRRTSLNSEMSLPLSRSHALSLSASASLLRYDTPGLGNDDDRDELFYVFNLTTIHQLSRQLTARFSTDIYLTHLVYLKLSANNTWNRVFRLSPRLTYTPSSNITSLNAFEVLANYTVYDFEYASSPVHSFAFRQFGFTDSTTIEITRRLGCDLFGQVRIYERGELRWNAFSVRPLHYFDERTYLAVLRYRPTERLLFSVGIRSFRQSRFGYSASERILESVLQSSGPTTRIRWVVTGRTELSMDGWYEQQTQTGLPDRSYTNITMSLLVHI